MILIDDEQIILDGLSQALNDIDTGFQLAGIFSNPFEALEFLDTTTVDLVISDIRMPKLSGIELAKILNKKFPKIKIIFLSAYSEFEYAKEALKYNVSSYILKPVDIDELTNELKEIADSFQDNLTIPSDNKVEFDIISAKKIASEILANRVHSKLNLYEELKCCNMNISANSPATLVKLKIENLSAYLNTIWKYGIMRLYSAFDSLMFDDNLYTIPISYSFDVITLIIIAHTNISSNNFIKYVSDFENALISKCAELFNLDVILNTQQIFNSISAVDISNNNEVYAYSESLFKKLQNTDLTITTSLKEIEFLGYNAKIIGEFLLFKFSEYSNNISFDVAPLISKLINAQDNTEITNALSDIITAIHNFFNESMSFYDRTTKTCLEYISKHYAEEITLQRIADIVNISPSHLSRIFKEITGKKYVDYLNDYRLEKAKKLLLSSSYNVNEIAHMVGYGSYPYFLRIFKLQTGMTPVEFKNNKS